jgi:hypothetical protein
MIPELRQHVRDAVRPFAAKYGFTVLPELADVVVISWLFFTVLQVSLSPALSRAVFPVSYGRANKRTRRNWYLLVHAAFHVLTCPQGRASRVTRPRGRCRRACFTVSWSQKPRQRPHLRDQPGRQFLAGDRCRVSALPSWASASHAASSGISSGTRSNPSSTFPRLDLWSTASRPVYFSVLSNAFLGVACLAIFTFATASDLCVLVHCLTESTATVWALLYRAFSALGGVRGLLGDMPVVLTWVQEHDLSQHQLVRFCARRSVCRVVLLWSRFLDKTGKTGSRLQLVNGIALLSTFFCVRLVWGGKMVSCSALRWRWDIEAHSRMTFSFH